MAELAKEASSHDQRFAAFIDRGRRLDRQHLTSRYPDALPEPAIPAESYTREDAEEAAGSARAMLEAVRSGTDQYFK